MDAFSNEPSILDPGSSAAEGSGQRTVCRNHAVTRHDRCERIDMKRIANCTGSAWNTDCSRYLTIRRNATLRYPGNG